MTSPTPGAVRTRYELRDRAGVHIATHIRTDVPGQDKTVIWARPDGRIGLGGLHPDELPLYAIERVNGPMVVVTEGEKACEALWRRDIVSVGTVTGASSTPGRTALADLNGLRVFLWPDNDDVGINHMLRVAEGLKGIAASVAWVSWPDAPPHGDAADLPETVDAWDLIDSAGEVPSSDVDFSRKGLGYTCKFPVGQLEFNIERLKLDRGQFHGEITVKTEHPQSRGDGHLVQSTFNISSDRARSDLAKTLAARAPYVKADWREDLEVFCRKVLAAEREGQPIVQAGGVQARQVQSIEYDLYPLLPKKRRTLLFGPPGTGKSYLAAAMVVAYTTGEDVLDWRVNRPGSVLVVDYEDEQDTWDRRIALIANGLGIDPPCYFYAHPIASITEEAERLARFCDEEDIGLVVLDSVGLASPIAHEGGDANESAIRLFKAMNMIGRTSILVDHVTKDDASRDRAKGPYGSQYKTALARQSWEVRRVGDDTDEGDYSSGHLALYDAKRNNSGKRPAMGIRIDYLEGAVRLAREQLQESTRRAGMTARDQVWEELAGGPKHPRDIAEATGIEQGTVRVTLLRMTNAGQLVRLDSGEYARRARDEE